MSPEPETRESLIVRLKDPHDTAAWEEFVIIYRPALIRFAARHGLQHADADDLAQQVLMSVSRKIADWKTDPAQGRFRTWLSKVVRNAAINTVTRRKADRGIGGTSAMLLINGQQDASENSSTIFDIEFHRETFRMAADHIRSEFHADTWDAFWLTAVECRSANSAANKTGKSIGAVYVARSRVMARLQEKVGQLLADLSGEVAK